MANDVVANAGLGGATFNATDCTTFTALSTGGLIPGAILYVGATSGTEPTGVTDAHPLPVTVRSSSGTEVTTFPISAASLPLPSGAATAAKQPALGTAGTASADVVTIQGIASGTVVPISDGGGSITVDGTIAATQSGTWTVTGAGGSFPVTNAGTFATQVDGAALTALQLIDDPVIVDDAAFTPATSKVMMAGFEADETGTDSVDEGDAGAARMTLDRKVITSPQPHTAGGLSIFRSIDLDEGTCEVVKASAGQIYGMWVANMATSTRFIKIYDAASGTVGTGTPVITLAIPGNTSDDIAGVFANGGMGVAFATGICLGACTGIADNDTGAPGTNDVLVNVFYK